MITALLSKLSVWILMEITTKVCSNLIWAWLESPAPFCEPTISHNWAPPSPPGYTQPCSSSSFTAIKRRKKKAGPYLVQGRWQDAVIRISVSISKRKHKRLLGVFVVISSGLHVRYYCVHVKLVKVIACIQLFVFFCPPLFVKRLYLNIDYSLNQLILI